MPAETEPAAILPARAKLNAAGEDRPAFLLNFPADPQLELLILAFEAGNFAQVRAQAPQLAASTADDAVRRAALELRRRTDPDPLLLVLLGLCIVLFVFLVSWVYTR
ncbi:MAG: hypothetical protein ABI895_31275 [Deltaproteobacteria bacterium]